MENKRPNQNNPFGSYSDNNAEVRRPKDVTADQWVPISTGHKPLDRTPKGARLTDSDLQVPQDDIPTQNEPSPQRSGKKKTKTTRRAKKKQKSLPQPSAQQQQRRSVVQGTHRDYAAARAKREQDHAQRQAKRTSQRNSKGRIDGKSGDELRLEKAMRDRRKKRLAAGLIVGAILLVAVLAIAGYAFIYGTPVKTISVVGANDTIYSKEDILKESGVSVGGNIFTVRRTRGEIEQRICSALPYIASVKVEVDFPDSVKLTVTPDTEKFIIVIGKRAVCLDKNDKVLSLKSKKLTAGKYRLKGLEQQDAVRGEVYVPTEANAARLALAKEIAAAVDEGTLNARCVIDLTDLNDVILCLDGRVNVYLGDGENIAKKIPLITEMYQTNFAAESTGYIDARFEGRYYYKPGRMERVISS